jgi:hypothetical protein
MFYSIVLYIGAVIFIISLARAFRQIRQRRELMKQRLYEITFAASSGVNGHLINCYLRAIKSHGIDSPQAQTLKDFNSENEAFIAFCNSIDSIERML